MGDVIRMTRRWLDDWGFKSKIIVGSVREVMNIQEAASPGRTSSPFLPSS